MDPTGHWRKIPEKDSTGFLLLSWRARGLFSLIWRKVDRGGVLDLGRHGLRGVCAHIASPQDWPDIEPLLMELIEAGELEWTPDAGALRIPVYEEAQDAMSESPEAMARKRRRDAERERKRQADMSGQKAPSAGHVRSEADMSGKNDVCPDAPPIDRQIDQTDKTRQTDTPKPPGGAGQVGLPGLVHQPGHMPGRQAAKRSTDAGARQVAMMLLTELSQARMRVDSGWRPLEPREANLHEIEARLREGVTADEIRHVIRVVELNARVNTLTKHHFDAVTPFRKSKIGRWLAMSEEQARTPHDPRTGAPAAPDPLRAMAAEIRRRSAIEVETHEDR